MNGVLYETLPPMRSERQLYDNASFQPSYMARALRRVVQDKACRA